MVFLDVTVLDKKGHPVVSGLTQDDFTITEGKQPQRIFSFEAPQTHALGSNAADSNPEGKAPITILVLDLLNSNFEDFAYIRYEVQRFLMSQPAQLASPIEPIVPASARFRARGDSIAAARNPATHKGWSSLSSRSLL